MASLMYDVTIYGLNTEQAPDTEETDLHLSVCCEVVNAQTRGLSLSLQAKITQNDHKHECTIKYNADLGTKK